MGIFKKAGKAYKAFARGSKKALETGAGTFVNPVLRAGASFPVSVVQGVQEMVPGGKTGFERARTSFGDVKRLRVGQKERLTEEEREQVMKPGEALAGALEIGTAGPSGVGKKLLGPASKLLGKADELSGASKFLKESAVNKMGEALAPGKEPLKKLTAKIAPEMLERGIKGSLKKITAEAERGLEEAGDAIEKFGELKGSTKVSKVLDVFEEAKKAFKTPSGSVVEPRAIKTLDKLADIIKKAAGDGEEISREELRSIRRIWDTTVYGGNRTIGKTAAEGSELALKKEAADGIRGILADEVSGLADINKKFSFFSDLLKIADATATRRVGQTKLVRKGIGASLGAFLGHAASKLSGIPGGEFVGVTAGSKAAEAAGSTFFKSMDASMRNAVADALVSGKYDVDKIAQYLQKSTLGTLKIADFKRFLNDQAALDEGEISEMEAEYQRQVEEMRAELFGADEGDMGVESSIESEIDITSPENQAKIEEMRAQLFGS